MARRSFRIKIEVNNRSISELIIDSHYEIKHTASISDRLIIELVQLLDDGDFSPESRSRGFEYFATDISDAAGKAYRLIWLMEDGESYIGVINAHRRR